MTEILFSYGIDVVLGSLVTDTNVALTYIKQGENFRQINRSGAIRLGSISNRSHLLLQAKYPSAAHKRYNKWKKQSPSLRADP